MRFIHTADWQIGRAFARVDDSRKRALLQQERFEAISRLCERVREHGAEFVIVAGDLFDSSTATKATVSTACAVIGQLGVPVLAIPGNHDHGGPGSLWTQPFFEQERAASAPNLRVLLAAEPVELAGAVLFPCPQLRRREVADPARWLREPGDLERFGDKPRIVVAHGSVHGFGGGAGDEDEDEADAAVIDLSRLPAGVFDYIALGDWHGTKQVGSHAWYSGTPELDRFPKGGDHDPGNILLVTAGRGLLPEVTSVRTARFGWHAKDFTFADDAGVDQLGHELTALLGQRADRDLLRLELRGSLGIAATTRLESILETLQARLLRLKLANHTRVAPSADEIAALTQRAGDPLISTVAAALVVQATGDDERAAIACVALRELHALCHAS